MLLSDISNMSRQDLYACIADKKSEMEDKLKRGELEESFLIGGNSYTDKEWKKLIDRVDKDIEEIKKEQNQMEEEKQEYLDSILQSYEAGINKSLYFVAKLNDNCKQQFPYENLAQNGVIVYNGVTFNCDSQKNAICLGDMSNMNNVISIPLSDGGSLMVNRENIGELANAMSMFSPEDIKRIMCAIADDKKAQEVQNTIEEEKNGIGDNRNNVKHEI